MKVASMNSTQKWLCEILEESTDRQDHLPWWERDWDYKDWRAWIACCFALPFYIKGEREVLVRALRCFCDAESGGSQTSLADACAAFCDNPCENETFITEVVNASPEMLRRAPYFFGGKIFQGVLNHIANCKSSRLLFISAICNLNSLDEKQTIVDYLVYLTEKYPVSKYGDKYNTILADCLKATNLSGGDSSWAKKYF